MPRYPPRAVQHLVPATGAGVANIRPLATPHNAWLKSCDIAIVEQQDLRILLEFLYNYMEMCLKLGK
jgi:hypothetical protein